MIEFNIWLKNDRVRRYEIISWIFLAFNVAAAILVSINRKEFGVSSLLYILLPALIVLFLLDRSRKSKHAYSLDRRFPGIILILPWVLLQLYWVAAAVFIVSIFQGIAARDLIVRVDAKKLSYPSFPRKTFRWDEIGNLILKDGLLTIDLKNNHVIQQLIDDRLNPVNEQEFNDFCRTQLKTVQHA